MKLPFAFTVHSVIQAVARQYTTLCRASPERRALTHKMGQRAKRLSVSMMFQLLCGISPRTDASNVAEPNLEAGLNLQAMEGEADLATARRVSRVLEHDDPKWEASEIGYTVIAPMQGYAQLAERETDVDAFSSAVASSYGLADDIFVNGSVGACFDDDLPLTLDTMGSREYVGETFSDAMPTSHVHAFHNRRHRGHGWPQRHLPHHLRQEGGAWHPDVADYAPPGAQPRLRRTSLQRARFGPGVGLGGFSRQSRRLPLGLIQQH